MAKTKRILKVPSKFFDPIKYDSVADSVIYQIESMILSGVLREGSKLPSERELSDQLEVSRPKLREALQTLATRGLLRIAHGDGVFVDKLGSEVMSPALIKLYSRHPSAIYDNLEYRREQEIFAARLASTRSTQVDRKIIQEILNAMVIAHEKDDHQQGAKLDLDFHNAIVNASHNRILIHMMRSLYELTRSGVFFNRYEILNIDEVSEFLLRQHQAIGEAVCNGKTEEAAKAAKDHMDYVKISTQEAFAEKEREKIAAKRKVRL